MNSNPIICTAVLIPLALINKDRMVSCRCAHMDFYNLIVCFKHGMRVKLSSLISRLACDPIKGFQPRSSLSDIESCQN